MPRRITGVPGAAGIAVGPVWRYVPRGAAGGPVVDVSSIGEAELRIRRAAGMGFGAVAVFSYSELFPEHRASSRATCVYQAFTSKRTTLSQAF